MISLILNLTKKYRDKSKKLDNFKDKTECRLMSQSSTETVGKIYKLRKILIKK